MLTIYRRHLDTCPQRSEGRACTKCACPIHCDGIVKEKRIRQAMNTVNWARAVRRMAEIEADVAEGRARKPVGEAVEDFLKSRQGAPETTRKRMLVMSFLKRFAVSTGIETVDWFRLEDLDAYRISRSVNPLSWSTELQRLRTFFDFCKRRKWCSENVARDVEMPRDPKPHERKPFGETEKAAILAACDTFGRADYERRRARAMILLLSTYGLRLSDVATLEKNRVKDGMIFLHALKNGAAIRLPLFPAVEFSLNAVPTPNGAPTDCPYFFWNGSGVVSNHFDSVGATLRAVFKKSGVEGAHAHRFRYSIATEILVKGGTLEDAANILGDSPAIVRKHYAKWSRDYQRRTIEVFRRIHGTPMTHGEIDPASPEESAFIVVPGAGIEPALPLPENGF
jgi:integrase/recombinase XerD